MAGELHEISYQLGEIRGHLEAIGRDTVVIRQEVTGVSERVTSLESAATFQGGVASQNKKISAGIGSLCGIISGTIVNWFLK